MTRSFLIYKMGALMLVLSPSQDYCKIQGGIRHVETFGNKKALVTCCVCSDAQSCLTLCDPMDCSPPGSSVHGTLQARILEWVVISSSRGSSQPRDQTYVSYISCIGRQILYH